MHRIRLYLIDSTRSIFMSEYANISKEFNEQYYDSADEFSEDIFENPGFVRIFEELKKHHSVLEVGCGSGIKLSQLTNATQEVHGCDINSYAVERAQKKFPHINFFVQDSTRFACADASYDAVMTFFVLEHVQDSVAFVNELLRITKPGGVLAIMCPNYGSPFFPSPPSKYKLSRMGKVMMYLNRFKKTLQYHMHLPDASTLHFNAVTPITSEYKTDYDTVVEPYLYDLKRYVEKKGYAVEYANSLWSVQRITSFKDIFYLPLKLIGMISLGKFWGPQVCIIIKK